MPLHEVVVELLHSCEDWEQNETSISQPDNGMQPVDNKLAVARLALVLEQVMQDLKRMINAQLRDGTHQFLSMCEDKT